jgi:pimeloyl-ACP methyl ester carboxylesterase
MMAYREAGDANAPVALFLHGNTAASCIWRNIIPHVAPVAHCIAPDLISFGQSGKPDITYRFFDHADYLDAFMGSPGVRSAHLVAQDWGAALALSGTLVSPAYAEDLAARLPRIAVVQLGGGRHNLQEDHPDAIGRSAAGWIAGIEAATARFTRQAA